VVKIMIRFDRWMKDEKFLKDFSKEADLQSGSFHSGTCFQGELVLRDDEAHDLIEAIKEGFEPRIYIWGAQDKDGVMRRKLM
jgi:hypothetical protein